MCLVRVYGRLVERSHRHLSLLDLSFLCDRHRSVLAVKERLPVRVQMQLGDNAIGRVDAESNGGTVVLLTVDALNVDDILAARTKRK